MADDVVTDASRAPWRMDRSWDWCFIPDGTQPCAKDPEWWDGEEVIYVQHAKRGCQQCPFLDECRLEGLVNKTEFGDVPSGVWGGMTARERRKKRKDSAFMAECEAAVRRPAINRELREVAC